MEIVKKLLLGGILLGACGGSANLEPESIGRLAFDFLKANNFTGYYTTLVATPTMVERTCPGLAGVTRYFDSGNGSPRVQEDRFIACRAAIDFSRATLREVRIIPRAEELTPPECVLPILSRDVVGVVQVGAETFYFTVSKVMQFSGGWRAYDRLKDCGNVPPS
jgi:hypothetical protein